MVVGVENRGTGNSGSPGSGAGETAFLVQPTIQSGRAAAARSRPQLRLLRTGMVSIVSHVEKGRAVSV
jgi:hypothetical protein